jgi:hypothetical protein
VLLSYKEFASLPLKGKLLHPIFWYKKFGFKIYNELDLGYKLFFLKKE